MRAHRTLADAYNARVVGAREENIEHVIHHLTKALENVSVEGPASKTDRFGKGPLDGFAGSWSEIMTLLGSSYGERVKVSWFMVKSVCVYWTGFFHLTCELWDRIGSICFALLGYLRANGLPRTCSASIQSRPAQAANPRPVSFVDITGQPK
jgi:hypothetical protein